MGNVQVRLPDDMERQLDALADELHTSRSEALRNALDEGLQALRLERAVRRYTDGDISLARASADAGVSIQRFAREIASRGIPALRYGPEDAKRDAAAAGDAVGAGDGA